MAAGLLATVLLSWISALFLNSAATQTLISPMTRDPVWTSTGTGLWRIDQTHSWSTSIVQSFCAIAAQPGGTLTVLRLPGTDDFEVTSTDADSQFRGIASIGAPLENPDRIPTMVPGWSSISGREWPAAVESKFELAFGWPMRALRMQWIRSGPTATTLKLTDGWPIDGKSTAPTPGARALPIRPIWTGLMVDTLVLAACIAMPLAALRWVRRRWRMARSRCVRCGYDLRGNLNRPCPECGLHSSMTGTVPLEIERTYLLHSLPLLPPGHSAIQIEQGYLPAGSGDLEGRIRKAVYPDGRVSFRHTVKTGTGLVRTEQEREIAAAEFDRWWPSTSGRRIRKTRYRVAEGDLTWEIDQFHGLDLFLAEVELPSLDTKTSIPPWLAPCVIREVTDEPAYRNYEIARRTGLLNPTAESTATSAS